MASSFEVLLLSQMAFRNNPPRFKGSILAATALATGVNINYTTITEDNYGGWNGTNHYWVLPAAGLYAAMIQFNWGSTAPGSGPAIKIFGGAANTTLEAQSYNAPSIGTFGGFSLNCQVRGNAGDQISVQIANAGFTTQNDSTDNNFFEIWQISQ